MQFFAPLQMLKGLSSSFRNDNVFNVYLFNKDGNHGYFSLLNRTTANLDDDAIIAKNIFLRLP